MTQQQQFTLNVSRKWNAANSKLNDEWKTNPRRRVTIKKLIAVAAYLWDNQSSASMFSQTDIAKNVEKLGFHDRFDSRIPQTVKDAIGSSLRKVRELTMLLRDYGFPILAISNCTKPKKDYGYWVARTQQEVDEYLERKTHEDSSVIKRRLDSSDARRRTWNIKEDPFALEKAAWEEGEIIRQARRKRINERIARLEMVGSPGLAPRTRGL